ncbi:hypothetical protein LBWT_42830 [Leptolyngbya boryana IAM M-101]|nr:hypothetical protein LBWT_42830 [Leptolyngbya boryana IAM M-101]BAS64667.1 hypothetical protein LBDG_42830 [Leptolyngbya boryana dg5]
MANKADTLNTANTEEYTEHRFTIVLQHTACSDNMTDFLGSVTEGSVYTENLSKPL